MAEFVDGFLHQTRADNVAVAGKSVSLLAQPCVGDDGAIAFELGLAENEGQNGNEEIERGDADDAAGPVGAGGQALQNCGGVILAAAAVEGEGNVEPTGIRIAGCPEGASEGGRQIAQEHMIRRLDAEADDLNRLGPG